MSFFTDSNGESLEYTTEFVNTTVQSLIPDGTQLLVAIASSEWTAPTNFHNGTIRIGLHVIDKWQYKDFIVYDTLKVRDSDSKRRDKALKKLITYDTLCKGLLAKADKAGKDIEDDNNLLERALNGGELLATFAVYEMERPKKDKPNEMEKITGNWVRSIGPKPKKMQEEDKHIEEKAKSQPPVQAAKPSQEKDVFDDFDDDIPF